MVHFYIDAKPRNHAKDVIKAKSVDFDPNAQELLTRFFSKPQPTYPGYSGSGLCTPRLGTRITALELTELRQLPQAIVVHVSVEA